MTARETLASTDAYTGQHQCIVLDSDHQGAVSKSYGQCKINRGHTKFITIDEFKRKGPSNFVPDADQLTFVWNLIDRTVRIQLSYTSVNRPDSYNQSSGKPYPLKEIRGSRMHVRYGTGYLVYKWPIHKIDPCPCLKCRSTRRQCSTSPSPSSSSSSSSSSSLSSYSSSSSSSPSKPEFSAYFEIKTSTHVLFDTSEAESAIFEFFYDTEDGREEDVKRLYGVYVKREENRRERLDTDMCSVMCVTHDIGVAETVEKLLFSNTDQTALVPRPRSLPPLLVSHPHGVSKRISFGEFTTVRLFLVYRPNIEDPTVTLKKGLKVRISGNLDNADVVKQLNLKQGDDDDDDDDDDDASDDISDEEAATTTHDDDTGKDCDDDDNDNNNNNNGNNNNNNNENNNDRNSNITSLPANDGGKQPTIYTTLSDLTILSPHPVNFYRDIEDINASARDQDYVLKDKWWTLPSDVKFAKDYGGGGGTPEPDSDILLPPHSDNGGKIEVYLEGGGGSFVESPFLGYPDDADADHAPHYWGLSQRYNYNMATCPGSSGAMVPYRYKCSFKTKDDPSFVTHFGCLGENNRNASGLIMDSIFCRGAEASASARYPF